jgi:serine/threonine-protein kinase RsbW
MDGSGAGSATLGPSHPRSGLRATRLELSPLDSSVPSFRLHARAVLHEWGLAALAGEAELVVSELTTNAVRAAAGITTPDGPPTVRLRITEQAQGVRIEVWDGNNDMPEPGPPGPHDREGGRGLLIVAALATRHGACATAGGGKCAWAILTLPSVPPAAGDKEASDPREPRQRPATIPA